MLMKSAVLSLAFTPDSRVLASGSQEGKIKVWQINTGECLRKFSTAHTLGITSLMFSQDGSQILSASFDHTIRLNGLKSGKALKEFRGHTSYVNSAIFSSDGKKVVSASSDGTLKIWDLQSTECLHSVGLYKGKLAPVGAQSPTITAVALYPKQADQVVVSNQSSIVYIVSLKGAVVQSMSLPDVVGIEAARPGAKQHGGAAEPRSPPGFLAMTLSPRGEFVYAAAEDRRVYVFGTESGRLVTSLEGIMSDIIGMTHHPFANMLAIYTESGLISIMK
ncbi:Serine/threonine-protein kinase smu1 [Polyrhizophydium stewartii]|uniref:WD40 repeat-containing protein SMU1 n=1 Tax=Polyrhizophydium stewartii TaxID=2732419 RepID=A0ABR4NEZ4_9FUNG